MITLLTLIIAYYLYCVPQEKIAKKIGESTTWMSYVPFARNVQRMRMAKMPMWKLMFVGSTFTLTISLALLGLIALIFVLVNVIFAIVVGIIFGLTYLVFYVISTYQYNTIIAEKFGFEKAATALVWMFIPVVGQVFTYLIALSDKYQVKGSKRAVEGSGTAVPPVTPSGEIGLSGVSGMYAGANFTMGPNDEFVIGRDSTLANIIISANGDKVSRRHCTVKYITMTGCYEVTDFSSNGTFYGNTRLLKGQPTSIPRGTTIVIGDKMNQFKLM